MRPRLRLFTGDEDGGSVVAGPQVTITFGEFAGIVTDACRFERTWLDDFASEELQVPEDLYEVLTAYWRLRPGA